MSKKFFALAAVPMLLLGACSSQADLTGTTDDAMMEETVPPAMEGDTGTTDGTMMESASSAPVDAMDAGADVSVDAEVME